MAEWNTNGACPICLTAELGMRTEALRGLMKLLEDGDLVRNTAGDADVSVFMRQGLKITQALKAANDALHKQPNAGAEAPAQLT